MKPTPPEDLLASQLQAWAADEVGRQRPSLTLARIHMARLERRMARRQRRQSGLRVGFGCLLAGFLLVWLSQEREGPLTLINRAAGLQAGALLGLSLTLGLAVFLGQVWSSE